MYHSRGFQAYRSAAGAGTKIPSSQPSQRTIPASNQLFAPE